MAIYFVYISVVLVAVSILYLYVKRNVDTERLTPVTFENAQEALNRMSSWATWLTGLQTAIIAGLGLIFKDYNQTDLSKTLGLFTITFLGFSIALSTWLLSGFPSVQLRFNTEKDLKSTANDIYEMHIFSFIKVKIAPLVTLIHSYFFFGMIGFISYIIISFSNGLLSQPLEKHITARKSAKNLSQRLTVVHSYQYPSAMLLDRMSHIIYKADNPRRTY